jgi:hypothetical protein
MISGEALAMRKIVSEQDPQAVVQGLQVRGMLNSG